MKNLKIDKKITQEIELLLINPQFQKDVAELRKKFAATTIPYSYHAGTLRSQIKELEALTGKHWFSLTNPEKKKFPLYFSCESGAAFWTFAISGLLRKEKVKLEKFRKAAVALTRRHHLIPERAWSFCIVNYLLNDVLIPPSFWFLDASLPDNKFDLVNSNFGIAIKPDAGEYTIALQIREDTSLHDIRRGWKSVDTLKKLVYGKKRFYPLSPQSLRLTASVIQQDIESPDESDWEKQERIFGVVTGTNFGKIETKRRQQVKRVRHKAKNRFGPKS